MSASKDIQFNTGEFLTRIKERDNDAIEMLVRRYTEPLLRTSMGLGFDAHTADELVQSVWTTFFDVVSAFQGRSHIRTFIFGILYNKVSEQRRLQKKAMTHDHIDEVMDSKFNASGHWITPPVDPEKFLLASETMDLIQRCIDALPTAQRAVFCFKEIEDKKTSEICKIMDVTVSHLGVLFYRARNELRECIEMKASEA